MKNSVTIFLHLSKVNRKVYVALDSRLTELDEFGIDKNKFNQIADEIEKIFQKILQDE